MSWAATSGTGSPADCTSSDCGRPPIWPRSPGHDATGRARRRRSARATRSGRRLQPSFDGWRAHWQRFRPGAGDRRARDVAGRARPPAAARRRPPRTGATPPSAGRPGRTPTCTPTACGVRPRRCSAMAIGRRRPRSLERGASHRLAARGSTVDGGHRGARGAVPARPGRRTARRTVPRRAPRPTIRSG